MKDEGMLCEIRVRDSLDKCWHDWFEGMTVMSTETGETVISGYVADQAALHGLLNRIRDLNLELISVRLLSNQGPS